jgi:hypothetical protein
VASAALRVFDEGVAQQLETPARTIAVEGAVPGASWIDDAWREYRRAPRRTARASRSFPAAPRRPFKNLLIFVKFALRPRNEFPDPFLETPSILRRQMGHERRFLLQEGQKIVAGFYETCL